MCESRVRHTIIWKITNAERAVGYPRRGQKVLFFWTLESSSPYLEKSGVIKSISLIFQIMVCRTRQCLLSCDMVISIILQSFIASEFEHMTTMRV